MTAAALLADLRRRGVELRAEGDRLRWRAPRGAVTPADLARLRAAKAELLRALAQDEELGLDSAPIVEVRERTLRAVLVHSARYGEAWLVVDPCMLPKLALEEGGRPQARPVLLAQDVARLQGKPEDAIRAALEVARAFPGARIQ